MLSKDGANMGFAINTFNRVANGARRIVQGMSGSVTQPKVVQNVVQKPVSVASGSTVSKGFLDNVVNKVKSFFRPKKLVEKPVVADDLTKTISDKVSNFSKTLKDSTSKIFSSAKAKVSEFFDVLPSKFRKFKNVLPKTIDDIKIAVENNPVIKSMKNFVTKQKAKVDTKLSAHHSNTASEVTFRKKLYEEAKAIFEDEKKRFAEAIKKGDLKGAKQLEKMMDVSKKSMQKAKEYLDMAVDYFRQASDLINKK